MNKDELFEFCKEWLKAWAGNDPNRLISYYSEDALYVDPEHRDGLRGHKSILRYFERLLAAYHDWSWSPIEIFPIETGCIVKWECKIPMDGAIIDEIGLDIVEIKDRKITRNEVYFDRTRLMKAIEERRRQQRLIR